MADVIAEEQAVELDELVGGEPAGADVMDRFDEQPIARLTGRACKGGVELTGKCDLLAWPTKRLVEAVKPNLKAFGMAFDGQFPTGSK